MSPYYNYSFLCLAITDCLDNIRFPQQLAFFQNNKNQCSVIFNERFVQPVSMNNANMTLCTFVTVCLLTYISLHGQLSFCETSRQINENNWLWGSVWRSALDKTRSCCKRFAFCYTVLYFSESFYKINILIPRYHFLIWPTRLTLPDIFMKYVITINVQAHDVQLIIQMILLVLFLLWYTFLFDV